MKGWLNEDVQPNRHSGLSKETEDFTDDITMWMRDTIFRVVLVTLGVANGTDEDFAARMKETHRICREITNSLRSGAAQRVEMMELGKELIVATLKRALEIAEGK